MFDALDGLTVILTRDTKDNAELVSPMGRRAARIIELPCVRTEPLAETEELADALAALREGDWVVVTSRYGADAVAPHPTRARFATVGRATAQRLRRHGRPVAFVPTAPSGERLARELPRSDSVVLLARSDRALPDLPRILRDRGFVVRQVVAYRTVVGARGDVALVRSVLSGSAERVAVVFHSPSAVEGMIAALDARLVARATVFVRGASTLRIARERLGRSARISLLPEEVVSVAHR